ncbi:MAG: HepT-like ribonuclease domain-containing protein [Ignavibacteria bacterium]
MPDTELVREILRQLLQSTEIILKRIKNVKLADDFLKNDRSLEKLDSLCMQLIALGENIKNLDKITSRKLLAKYPEFEWKKAMGMRDIISHHYFDLNSEVIFQVCKEEIPKLNRIIKTVIMNLAG